MVELLEREQLLAQLEGLRAEGGRLVFVGGEAGVGKTALVRAFADRVRVVRYGSCENLAAPAPLGPFLDVGLVADETRAVAAAALVRGGTIVLEDVHWADGASLDVLRVLGRRVDGSDAFVVATYRDDEVTGDHPLRVVLGELASSRGVVRVSVPRLSLDAVRELAEPHGADAEAIHRLTLGNAFYVTEILASGSDELPATVRDAVLARAALLADPARRLLEAIAVVPRRAELWLLEAVAPDEVAHLDECLASGVLRADGDAVVFRHELARLAVESELSPGRRRSLHAAILAALEPTGDEARLAHHAEEAGDEAAVLRHALPAASTAAAASSHREAAAQYARVLRHARGLPDAERAELLTAHAQEAAVSGDPSASLASRLEAIEIFRRLGDPLLEGDTWARVVSPYVAKGQNAEAEAASERAIALLEPLGPSPELVFAYNAQASLRMLNRDNADGVSWGRRALGVAERLGDRKGTALALNYIGTSHVMAGDYEPGVEHLLRSLELARALEDEVSINSALGMLGSGLAEMYQLGDAESYLEQQVAFAEERDLSPAYSASWLACLYVYRGRWDEVAPLAVSAIRTESVISQITGWIALGRVRARRGDPAAFDALDKALGLAQPGGHLQRLGHVHAARAEAAWLAGDGERAVSEARAPYPLALEKRHLWFAGELAYWQWRAGALDDAPAWIAEPYRAQIDGDTSAAVEAWRERGCPYEAARTLADAGDEAALAELDALGARPAADALRRRLGIRGPRAATRENSAGLTARELDVLGLLAQGLRNGEIAERLYLSTRTVDHHVSAILRKLQARSRAEATAVAMQRGLVQTR